MTSNKKIPMVLMVSGYKRAGKDTVANMIKEIVEEKGAKVEILSFASPLKQITKAIFEITDEQLDDFKNNEKGIFVKHSHKYREQLTDFRKVLQRVGNEAIKPIFGDDVWLKEMNKKIKLSDADLIVIPDFRFLIEDNIPNSITIRVNNDDIKNDSEHPSETELEKYDFMMYLDNTGYRLTKELVRAEMLDNLELLRKRENNG